MHYNGIMTAKNAYRRVVWARHLCPCDGVSNFRWEWSRSVRNRYPTEKMMPWWKSLSMHERLTLTHVPSWLKEAA